MLQSMGSQRVRLSTSVCLFFEHSLDLHPVLAFLLYQVQSPDKYVPLFVEIHTVDLAVFCHGRAATGGCRLIPAQILLFLIKVLRLEKCNCTLQGSIEYVTAINPLLGDDNDKIYPVASNIFVNITKE